MHLISSAYLLLFLAHVFHLTTGISNWWYLSQLNKEEEDDGEQTHPAYLCELIPKVYRKQRQICRGQPQAIVSVLDGVRDAIQECQYQFRSNKWNCSTFQHDPTLFGKYLVRGGTREVSFLHAITTAISILNLAKDCAMGKLACGCHDAHTSQATTTSNKSKEAHFKWQGCPQNLMFSTNFVRRFVDAGERGGRDTKAKMTFHNNRAGRQVFEKEASSLCKCHGLSGSCTMQTCWRTPPSIRSIGDSLKEQYDGAIRVTIDPAGRLIPVNRLQKKPNKLNLVYYEDSPDFCSPNPSKGSLGTGHRACNASSDGEDSCDILCCGRGWESVQLRVVYRCECRFRWCCDVLCNECHETRVENYCKPYNRSKRRINQISSSFTKEAATTRDGIIDFEKIPPQHRNNDCASKCNVLSGSNRSNNNSDNKKRQLARLLVLTASSYPARRAHQTNAPPPHVS